MSNLSRHRLFIGGLVVLAAAAVLTSGHRPSQSGGCCPGLALTVLAADSSLTAKGKAATATNAVAPVAWPRLLDLGANKCIPCKKMGPILEELKAEYQGQMEVEFVDVWKDPAAGKAHKIQLIPTQIFFDATGKELFRHEGFFAKEDILAKWKALGVKLGPPNPKVEKTKSKSKAENPRAGEK